MELRTITLDGFAKVGDGDHDFRGRTLHRDHWMLDLRASGELDRTHDERMGG